MSEEYTAWKLQVLADSMAADLATQDPQPTGNALAWQQKMIQDSYTDAAHTTAQPEE